MSNEPKHFDYLAHELSASLAEREALIDDILSGKGEGVSDAPPDWGTIALVTFTALMIGALFAGHALGLY